MMGESLPPLFLTQEEVKFRTKSLQILRPRLFTFRTAKGYQTEASMLYYWENVIKPYVHQVQTELHDDNAKVWLVMDQCASHITQNVMDAMRAIHGLQTIKLPAHSSHFTQPLDASLFGTLKVAYRSTKTEVDRPKYESKIVRCYNARYRCCVPGNVIASWQMTGIDFKSPEVGRFQVVLNVSKLVAIMKVKGTGSCAGLSASSMLRRNSLCL